MLSMRILKSYVNNFFVKLKASPFVKNVLIVMSGTVVVQAINFAFAPFLSRLYSPSDFGIYGSFNAVSLIITAGVTLGYDQALILPKEKKDAVNLFILSCISTIMISGCCLAVFLLIPKFVNALVSNSNAWILALLIAEGLFGGLYLTCQAWCVRLKAFKETSTSQVICSMSSNGTQIVFGCFKKGSIGLIIGTVLADIVASFNLIPVVLRDLAAFRRHVRWDRMKQLAKDYRDFPVYFAFMNVINSLSRGLPVLLLMHFYGIAIAGAYAFGMRILSAPMGLVLRALRQVLLQKASEKQNLGGRLLPLYLKITTGLFALIIFPALILFIWAPRIFTWIFGPQWHTAGEFARWLIPWLIFMFCNLPSVLFARVIRIQRKMFFLEMVLLAARILVLVIGGMYISALHTVMLFSMVSAIMNIIFIVIVGYTIMKKEGSVTWQDIQNNMMER